MSTRTLLASATVAILFAAFGNARAATTPETAKSLRDQLREAEHVVHATIVAAELNEMRVNGAIKDCGTVWRARTIERFRGDVPQVFSFTGYSWGMRVPFVMGQEVLLLLTDSSELPQGVFPSGKECRPKLPQFIVTSGSENAFVIEALPLDGKPEKRLFFSDLTLAPEQARTLIPKKCLVDCMACEISTPASLSWSEARSLIQKWTPLPVS